MPITFSHKHLLLDDKAVEVKKEPKLQRQPENAADSDDDFQLAPNKKRRKCRTIVDEDSGPEIPPLIVNEDSQNSMPAFLPFSPDVRTTDTIELDEAKYVDKFFLESLCNVAELTGQNTAIQVKQYS